MGTCKKIAGMIGAYVYGDLSPDEMRLVRLHAEECSDCSSEIEARIKAISLIPTGTPTLTDDERQRIMWTVKGAIRAREERRGFNLFRPSFAQGLALATLIAAAFIGGAVIGHNKMPPKVIVKNVPSKAQPAAVQETSEHVAEKPVSQPAESIKRLSNNIIVAGEPFIRYPMREIYRGGNIDRDAEKEKSTLPSILGGNNSELVPEQPNDDNLGLPALSIPEPLSETTSSASNESLESTILEPQHTQPAQETPSDNTKH